MSTICIWFGLLAYVLTGRLIMRRLAGTWREVTLAVLNGVGGYCFLFWKFLPRFGIVMVLIVVFYLVLCLFAKKSGGWPWLAFITPIATLVIARYLPAPAFVTLGHALGKSWHGIPNIIGLSYLTFRCSRLVLEIRNGLVKKPNFIEYFNFAFFLPTIPVGPINTYANYRRGFAAPYDVPLGRSALRILVGAVKYLYLGNLCNQLGYAGLLFDDHAHHWAELPVAMLFYYLYIYLNFSGFCDMAIGAAAIIGIPVPENFENPFAARNVKDFWNRWHITLSIWMRDILFSPLSKYLVGKFGLQRADQAIAITIMVVFLLVGLWHGAGWNFAAFGAMHALGVVTNHYYTGFLKKQLGRDGFKVYNANPWVHAAAVSLTFCYCAACFMVFANTLPQVRQIFASLR